MKEKIFIAGTDDVKWVIEKLYDALEDLDYEPYWFHKRFQVNTEDTMKECLINVENSDRFILVLDKRYGLPYRNFPHSITEEEFLTAFRKNIPILIFITTQTFAHSKIYHNKKKIKKRVTNKHIKELGLKADKHLFEFIDRIQHMEENGEDKIIWIEVFNFVDDIIEQIKYKWERESKISFEQFIAPWVLPNEEIPLHIKWTRDFEYDYIEINYPKELDCIEVINVNNFKTEDSKLIIPKDDVRYLQYNNSYLSYFGIIFLYKDINFKELKLFKDILIVFKRNEKIIRQFNMTAKIFRPILINISNLHPITIDNNHKNHNIHLNLESKGFGYVSTFIEVQINKIKISFDDSILERIEKKLKKKYGDVLRDFNDDEFKEKLKLKKDSVQNFIKALDNYISKKEELEEKITDYFTEENVELSLIFDFLIELVKEVKIQNKYENLLLKSPSLELPKERFNELINRIIIYINYKDLAKNEYPPVQIPLNIIDKRDKPQNSVINFQIKINNIVDNSFYDIESVGRD